MNTWWAELYPEKISLIGEWFYWNETYIYLPLLFIIYNDEPCSKTPISMPQHVSFTNVKYIIIKWHAIGIIWNKCSRC